MAAGLEFGGSECDLCPRGGGFFSVQARSLERVLVVIKHGGGAVEREAQHLAVGCGVVAGHGGNVDLGVKFVASVGHDLAHGDDRTFAGHHGGGTHFEHLQDVGCIARTESGHSGGHGFVVSALEGGQDAVFLLAGVEFLGQVIDPFAVHGGHGVPPLDVGLGLGGGCNREGGRGNGGNGQGSAGNGAVRHTCS